MTASALLNNNLSIEEWLVVTTFVEQRNQVLIKNLFPSIKRSKQQEENVFLGTTTLDSLFL